MGHKERSLCSSGPVSESTCLHVSHRAPFPPFLARVCGLPVRPAGPAVASCPLSPTHSCCSSAPQPVPPKPALRYALHQDLVLQASRLAQPAKALVLPNWHVSCFKPKCETQSASFLYAPVSGPKHFSWSHF